MHIQEGKPNKKTSAACSGPKHEYRGGRKYQPKHAFESSKKRKRGIAIFVVSIVFLIGVILCGLLQNGFAVIGLPISVVCMVLSICAVSAKTTFFSVSSVVVSSLATVIMAVLIVLAVLEYFTGTSMASFIFIS